MKLTGRPIMLATLVLASLGTLPNFASSAPADCAAQTAAGQPCPPDVAPVAPPAPVVTPPATTPPAAANPPAAPPPAANNTNQRPPGMENRPRRDQTSGFQYDPNRHNRNQQRNGLFRFFFNGYYYDQPYWQQRYYQPSYSRINCAEGRRIVADADFVRIRTVECNGPTFTYRANRGSHSYRVYVNARRGTISGTTRLN
jgi:hypothetical protein